MAVPQGVFPDAPRRAGAEPDGKPQRPFLLLPGDTDRRLHAVVGVSHPGGLVRRAVVASGSRERRAKSEEPEEGCWLFALGSSLSACLSVPLVLGRRLPADVHGG